jgi:glycosyltransferase involved in cell wall biosynthesis
MRRVLCLIESKPFQYDNRMRCTALALVDAGFGVSVVSPGEKTDPLHEFTAGVHLYRYRKPSFQGVLGHCVEYAVTLLCQSLLSVVVLFRHGFDYIEVTNPPDILWLVAWPYRFLLRKRIVFDHQDPSPELFISRYPGRSRLIWKALLGFERMSFALAHHVIVNNETSRAIATGRGGVPRERTTLVRNAPDLGRDFPAVADYPGNPAAGILVGYLGMMNPQDHLDNFLRMADIVRRGPGGRDVRFVMIGDGDARPGLIAQRDGLGLTDVVEMPGRLPWAEVIGRLKACEICIQPDLPSPYTRAITMCKLLEYMALGRAVVAHDLPETRVSGGDAIAYAAGYSAEALAAAVLALVNDPDRRRALGRAARRRIEDGLAWEHQAPRLVGVFERA